MGNIAQLAEQNNVFLIDWLTVVFHDQTVAGVQRILGLLNPDIPWRERKAFTNGYPVTTYWNNISIRWGADIAAFYTDDPDKSAAEKARNDMGICLDMSGTGCRAYETYGCGDWIQLLKEISDCCGGVNITRLDLAYDDHIGILDIHKIEEDARDRNLTCKARKVRTIWSDDWDRDLQGLTIEVGSRQSNVLIRIYDKAAERGYDATKHWIRVELQLRQERASCAVLELLALAHVGRVSAGILRNYCIFRTPTPDSNKCRWPVAPYWDRLLLDMDRVRIVITPGESYNYSKTEKHMKLQYGQAFIAYYRMHGELNSFLFDCMREHPNLKPKYEDAIADYKLLQAEQRRRRDESRRFYGFEIIPEDDPFGRVDMVDIFGPDLGKEPDNG